MSGTRSSGGGVSLSAANTWAALQTFSASIAITPAVNSSAVTVSNVTHTASSPVFNATQTINGAVNAVGIFYNMIPGTTPPNLATSDLIKLQYNSSDIFTVRRDGNTTFGSSVTIGAGNLILPVNGTIYFAGRSNWSSPSSTSMLLRDSSETNFAGVLQIGGTTSSFPGLKRSTTILQARLADDSAFAPLQGALRTSANAVTGLTAGVLAELTNASIVITDASGQDYRVACII